MDYPLDYQPATNLMDRRLKAAKDFHPMPTKSTLEHLATQACQIPYDAITNDSKYEPIMLEDDPGRAAREIDRQTINKSFKGDIMQGRNLFYEEVFHKIISFSSRLPSWSQRTMMLNWFLFQFWNEIVDLELCISIIFDG